MEPVNNGFEERHGGPGGVEPPAPVAARDDEFLTPDRARQAREQAERGFIFRLKWTGGKAHVRRIDPTDRLVMGQLPDRMQGRVLKALTDYGQTSSALDKGGNIVPAKVMNNLAKQEDLVNAYCIIGFLKPRLIASEADRTSDDEVVVTDIAWQDRRAFWGVCTSDEEAAANRLEPFPDEPLSPLPGQPGDETAPTAVPISWSA